ncbi:MAG: lamin tail domain-containing protein [Pyrinomonadaceae bacterium]
MKFIQTQSTVSCGGKGTVWGYLTWNDGSVDETGFVIEERYMKTGVWSPWTAIATVGPDVTMYELVLSQTVMEYRVKAVNGSASSPYSNVANANAVPICESTSCPAPSALIVSEFRLRGAAGAKDEFVELYNNSASPLTVCTTDNSGGWTLAARTASGASAAPVFTVPNGTVIPARGHYLGVNASPSGGYSLSGHPAGNGTTATGDITYTSDIEDDSGVALFKTANPANFTAANRLDAAGFSGAAGTIPDLYREGTGLSQVGTQNGDYTLYRKMTSASGGTPQDTGNNVSDFSLVATNGGFYGSLQASLGAPGPENLSSPIQRNSTLGMTNLDTSQGSSAPPNRVRDFTSDLANNSTFGTLAIRRTVYNNTGGNVTRIRFRVVTLTTWPAPVGVADVRMRTSGDVQVQVQGVWRTVKGTTLVQPPNQPNGGGYNSAMEMSLPQPLAPGATADVQFLLGLQQTGGFSFLINIEALP